MPLISAEEVLKGAFDLTDAIKPLIEETRTAIHALPQDDVEGRAALESEFLAKVHAETGANEQDIMSAVRIRQEAVIDGHDAALIAAEVHSQLG